MEDSMGFMNRRVIIGFATAMLVGGWGATRYAGQQQELVEPGKERLLAWQGESRDARKAGVDLPASRTVYATGLITMVVGAGVLGYLVLSRRGGGMRGP
jgi:hypothetical protein